VWAMQLKMGRNNVFPVVQAKPYNKRKLR